MDVRHNTVTAQMTIATRLAIAIGARPMLARRSTARADRLVVGDSMIVVRHVDRVIGLGPDGQSCR